MPAWRIAGIFTITRDQPISWLGRCLVTKKKFLTLKSSAKSWAMKADSKKSEITKKIQGALDKAIRKVIAEEKARNGYLVVGDKKGKVKKIPAKDL